MRKLIVDTGERVETGGLQVNDDWAGFFIRGDDCLKYFALFESILDNGNLNRMDKFHLSELTKLIYNSTINVNDSSLLEERK